MELFPESPVRVQNCTCLRIYLFSKRKVALNVQATTLLLLVLLLFLCVKPRNLEPRVVYTNQLFINCGSN